MSNQDGKDCGHCGRVVSSAAQNGKWYKYIFCFLCNRYFWRYSRLVDQKSDLDCAAADGSQGIC